MTKIYFDAAPMEKLLKSMENLMDHIEFREKQKRMGIEYCPVCGERILRKMLIIQ